MPAKKKQKTEEKDFYSFSAKTLEGKTVDFSSLAGKVILVENVASL